jgi:DNA invertase Pin-like site-specific DNA recombinase
MPPTGTLIGYARVSTKDQSTKQQVEALKAFGVEDDNLFVETVSGVSHRRPRLEEAMAKADSGDTFVVWKFDRFGRSIMDLLKRMKMLEDKGVGFVSLTDQVDTTTPAGRLMVHVLAAIAQFERDMISERTRAGMQHKIRTTGYRPGPAPKLAGAPGKRAQELRDEWHTVPEIAAAIEKEFGLKVSKKTLYNQTRAPGGPPRKRKQ